MPAWTGDAQDQVLQHAGRPRRLLDNGRRPGAAVRFGLDHRSSRAAGTVFLRRLCRAPGGAVHRDPLRQARVRIVGPGRDRPVVRRAGGRRAGGGRRDGRRSLPAVRRLAGRSTGRRDRGGMPGPGRGAGAVRDVRQRAGPGTRRGPGLGGGTGAGSLGSGAEGADRSLHRRSHGRRGGRLHPDSAGRRLGCRGGAAAGGLLRHRHPGLAPGDPGAHRGTAPRGGQGYQVRAGAGGRGADPRGDADPAAGFEPLVLPRRLGSSPGCGARFPVRAGEPGAAADRPRARGRRTDRPGADQPGHRQAPVRRAADGGGARGEHPAQAAGALAGPDRDLGDRAAATSRPARYFTRRARWGRPPWPGKRRNCR